MLLSNDWDDLCHFNPPWSLHQQPQHWMTNVMKTGAVLHGLGCSLDSLSACGKMWASTGLILNYKRLQTTNIINFVRYHSFCGILNLLWNGITNRRLSFVHLQVFGRINAILPRTAASPENFTSLPLKFFFTFLWQFCHLFLMFSYNQCNFGIFNKSRKTK